MWNTPDIREGEDEAALKARFVELCAKYPNEDHFSIGRFVFKDLVDPGLRGEQAATIWFADLEVREAIAEYRRSGGPPASSLADKEQASREVLALAQDTCLPAKDRVAAYKLFAEINGMIEKITSNTNRDLTNRPIPNFVIARYDD